MGDSASAGTTGDADQRILDLYDASSGQSMCQITIPRANTGRDRSRETRFVSFPGNGVLFPGGIKLTMADIYEELIFIFQGPGVAV